MDAEVSRGGHQPHRHVDQPEAERAGPDRAGHQAFAFFFLPLPPFMLASSAASRSSDSSSASGSGSSGSLPAAFVFA